MARANGIPVVWFWQPAIEFRPETRGDPEVDGRAFGVAVAQAAVDALAPDVVDITHALDGSNEPLYWDNYHTNELGAMLTAQAMYRHLGRRLAQLSGQG